MRLRLFGPTLTVCAGLLTASWGWAQRSCPGRPDPGINTPFENPNVKEFIARFEDPSREVYAQREAIVRTLGLKPGMAAADVGAGTGVFTRLIADQVGPEGRVYAVDIAPAFLNHIAAESKRRGQTQVATVRGTQDSTALRPDSIDLAFLCDTYPHLEHPARVLASIHRALRPGGRLVVIDLNRVEGKSREFVLKHVRASQAVFRAEIEAAGFQRLDTPNAPALRENFFLRFRKVEKPSRQRGGESP